MSGEIGALLDTGEGRTRWLVGTLKTDREHARERDQQALEALAADTAESLARSRLIHELERLAGTDALTGLVNRSVFADEVGRAVAEGRVIGCPPAVLYLDLDAFKAVNDRFGHHVGDLLVCEVADQLRACVRPSDVVARLGGDEFAVLLEGLDDTDALRVLAQRILDRLGAERAVDGHALTVGVSVGLAVADAGTSADDLLRNADMAMYDATSRRRPVPALYRPEWRERSLDRAEPEADLRRALDGDELRVDHQPILRLPDGRVHGLEALARWEHPTRGPLTAGAFIDVAEQSGLIGQLGERVLRQVMQDAPTLVETAGMPITLCVNVSARQLADSSLSELVRSPWPPTPPEPGWCWSSPSRSSSARTARCSAGWPSSSTPGRRSPWTTSASATPRSATCAGCRSRCSSWTAACCCRWSTTPARAAWWRPCC